MRFFINETIVEDGGYRVFQLPEALQNPQAFTLYADDVVSSDAFAAVTREFSYSLDGNNWSSYQPLTTTALQDAKLLGKGNIFMKVKFNKHSGSSPVDIKSIDVDYTSTPSDDCDPSMISKYFGLDFCLDSGFNPFAISAQAAELESALNGFINKSIGMEVVYFHILPDMSSADSILNEYSTFRETGLGGKCIKVMVPENSLPDPSLLHNEWGLDFEKFEVNVQIEYFETVWGKDQEPRQEDILYFPKFNRVFYVSSVKAVRGTDGIGQYFAMNLKRYDKNTAVKMTDESQALIDALLEGHSHDENFRDVNQAEGLDLTNPIQNEIKTIALDSLRSYIDPFVLITNDRIINNGTPIANHAYDLTHGRPGQLAITYKPKVVIKDDVAISFWLNRNNPATIVDETLLYYRNLAEYLPFVIVTIQRQDARKTQIIVDKPINQTGIYVNCFIQQGTNVFLITQIIDDYTFIVNTPDVVPSGTYKITTCEILPSTYSQYQGIFAAFVSGKYVYLIIGQTHYKFDTGLAAAIAVDNWLAFMINISSTHSFIEVYVYAMENRFPQYPGKYSTVLKQLSKLMKPITTAIIGYTDLEANPLYLSYSNSRITNIRLWNQPVEEELHSLILNQPQVQAVSKTFIIDNADPVYRLDKLGKGIVNFADDTPDINALDA